MKITIVRHGKTDYNVEGKIQSRRNIPLNDSGRRECKKLKYKMKDMHFDVCFSSPLIRAVETAMILVGDRVEIKLDDRLIERNLGQLEGEDFQQYDGEKYWDYQLNLNDRGIESVQDLLKRINNFIEDLKQNEKDKSVLIITHGGVVRGLHHLLHHTKLHNNLCNFSIDNCYIEVIDYYES